MRSKLAKGLTVAALAAAVAVPTMFQHLLPAAATADPADRALYERLCGQVMATYDSARGGFVRKDGTPCEAAIELSLARGSEGDTLALARALRTLRWMHGLLDTVGGGYMEGTRDLDPSADSFNKRTDSNMRRLELLTRAAAIPGGAWYERDARRVVDYAERQLMDPRGGFVTSQVGSRDLEPESNGIALTGWWRWAVHTSDQRRRNFAFKSNDRLWRDCRDEELGMVRRDNWGKVREGALLADQSEIGLAFLHGWQAAGRDSDLLRARVLGTHIREHFEDAKKGGLRDEYAAERFGHSHRSPRPFDDNAGAARFLAELGAATGDTAYTNVARRAWAAFDKQFEKPRIETAEWALAIRATWAEPEFGRGDWGAEKPEKAPANPRVKSYGKHK
jgi:uncharacterized protein YyaL (SSP411 family)